MKKWLQRTLLFFLLLLVLIPAAAWLSFPLFAPLLLNRALEGKPFQLELSGLSSPSTSGISFRRLKTSFTPPPDGCSDEPITFTLSLFGGRVSINPEITSGQSSGGFLPTLFNAEVTLLADSLSLSTNPDLFGFSDTNPLITARISGSLKKGLSLTVKPLSISYPVVNGMASREKLRLEGINYNLHPGEAGKWQQPVDTLRIARLTSDGYPSPVSNFRALFGSKQDPLNPCTLTLSNCSVDLFEWQASSQKIDYDLKDKKTSFTLSLAEIPLAELLDFFQSGNKNPAASGKVSGSLPIEFQDSTVTVRNASLAASKGSKIIFYTKEKRALLSFDIGSSKGGGKLLKDVNATIKLNSGHKKLSGLALNSLSATLLGGKITSTPFSFDPSTRSSRFTIKLNNIKALERVKLQGDFKGSLSGSINGVVPITIDKSRFAVNNARLHSTGGGKVTIATPRKKQTTQERILSSATSEASYTFTEPDIFLTRTLDGGLTIRFKLSRLGRKTSSGELLLIAPLGTITLWKNRLHPDIVSLTDFSSGLLDGSLSIARVDYDMAKKSAETTLHVNNIPLQKLLDLQGTKKIFATGTIKGDIPIALKNELFEIRNGDMNAEQNGQIIYATTPEERAAANQGLRTTYEALSNFLYVHLNSSLSMTPDGKSVIAVQLKGSNPDYQNGRPVELNLNVEQNLLELMRSLSISSNVEEIISEKALQMQKK
ncbi:YdbH domain-containing protein [Chlorobium sp. KB01]|uniref:intermembrane phospholipid transport protein YdbH family protein n=1 Tax=Chlorobium sp. KB01 TaxID=1917528 RepID=UPI00097828C5|nr:YdbH domain-containing protein [Chlorobium sp. KB01]